jgi:type II secretory pathway pseudopilin PulG
MPSRGTRCGVRRGQYRRHHGAPLSQPAVTREGGFSLIEVVIAIAMLLALMGATTGMVLTALRISTGSRLRDTAAEIASGQLDTAIALGGNVLLGDLGFSGQGSVPQLSPDTVTQGGATFTIEREVAAGNGSCQAPSPGGSPMELVVTIWVTWAQGASGTWWTGNDSSQVEESTIVAVPATAIKPADGSVMVTVTDDSNVGQALVTVTINTTPPESVVTTSLGCALFPNLTPTVAPQTYTVTASRSGWIDSNNDFCLTASAPSCPAAGAPALATWSNVTVTAGVTTTLSGPPAGTYYAEEAQVAATYSVPQVNGISSNLPYVGTAGDLGTMMPLSFYDVNLPTDPYVAAPPGLLTPPSTDFQVYPWAGYSVVAGSCGQDSIPDGSWTPSPPLPKTDGVPVAVSPGGSSVVNLGLTPVMVVVKDSHGNQLQGAAVTASASDATGGTDTNCPGTGQPTAMPTLQMGPTCPSASWLSGTACTVSTAYTRSPAGSRNVVLASNVHGLAAVVSLATTPVAGNAGQPVSLVANVQTAAGSPIGVVTFYEGNRALGCATVGGISVRGCETGSAGTATIETSSLPPGYDSLRAVFSSGDNSLTNATSSAVTVIVRARYELTAAGYNNTGICSYGACQTSNYDGDGFSYSSGDLASQSVDPGSTVTSDGFNFTWPNVAAGTADNYKASGQTVAVSLPSGSSSLGILGSATNATSTGSSGTVTVNYSDGTTSTSTVTLPDWCTSSALPAGVTKAISLTYRVSTSGYHSINNYVFATSVPVTSSKTVVSVTLPASVSNGQFHVFAFGSPVSTPTTTTTSTPAATTTSTPAATTTSAPAATTTTAPAATTTTTGSGAATTTSLTSSANPAPVGSPLTLTASVAPVSTPGTPTGSVKFDDTTTSTTLGTCTLPAGMSTCSISVTLPTTPTTQDLKATYSGDATFAASTGSLSQVQLDDYVTCGLPYGTFRINATYDNSSLGEHWSTANWGSYVVVEVKSTGVSYTSNGTSWTSLPPGVPVEVVVQ